MRPLRLQPSLAALSAMVLALLVVPGAAAAKPATKTGSLTQLRGPSGCLVDSAKPVAECGTARALRGPGPFLGSHAVAISPDGRNVYVAASKSNAVAIFSRSARTGALTQAGGSAGCIALAGTDGCAPAVGLVGPNSVAVSPDGKDVYATSVAGTVTGFRRDPVSGALTQLVNGSCLSDAALPGCATGRALKGADVVDVSPDGKNVYVGAFFGNAVAVLTRDPATGTLTQAADTTGCLAAAIAGCAPGFALGSVEGLAVSGDGASVYVAAATGSAVDTLVRDPATGGLTQATDGSGCLAYAATTGCTLGHVINGANAVTVSPDDTDVYVTSLFSNSLTTFGRTAGSGTLTQGSGTTGCAVYLLAIGCSLAQAMSAPEGLVVSPDGTSVYTAAYTSNAIGVFDRTSAGSVMQKGRAPGCVSASRKLACTKGRGLTNVSSLAVSPDNRFVYAVAHGSNAITVFSRVVAAKPAS